MCVCVRVRVRGGDCVVGVEQEPPGSRPCRAARRGAMHGPECSRLQAWHARPRNGATYTHGWTNKMPQTGAPNLQHGHAVVWLAEEGQRGVVHEHAPAQVSPQPGHILVGEGEGEGGRLRGGVGGLLRGRRTVPEAAAESRKQSHMAMAALLRGAGRRRQQTARPAWQARRQPRRRRPPTAP